MKSFYCCLLLVLLLSPIIFAQKESIQEDPAQVNLWIIQMESGKDWSQLQDQLDKQFASLHYESIAPYFNIYGVGSKLQETHKQLKNVIQKHPSLVSISKDYKCELRFMPSDELYSEQWAIRRIQADQTWTDAKGDTTIFGDKIVIAVVDNGARISHPDLEERIWKNPDEVPNNGIDDDNNGFIDDYRGWNFQSENDQHPNGSHGSPVAGIVGATTDNDIGIAGTAYRTHLLPLSTPTLRSNRIISAMEYAFLERKKYNETDGREGTFIVAVNFSLGLEETFPDSVPLWCNMHDSLGAVGILSIGAVTNTSTLIDSFGDIPALCSSDHIIAVTRTDMDDELSEFESGFSETHVDLGAPGDDILSTSGSGEYRLFQGTSAAAPFVSGAIATIYSIPCESFMQSIREEPAQSALVIKDLILNNVEVLPTLMNKTVTGGRLNIYNALVAATQFCELETAPFDIQAVYPNPSDGIVNFRYTVNSFDDIEVQVFDIKGREVLERSFSPQVFGDREFSIDLKGFYMEGLYFVSIRQGSDKKWSKLVIQRNY